MAMVRRFKCLYVGIVSPNHKKLGFGFSIMSKDVPKVMALSHASTWKSLPVES